MRLSEVYNEDALDVLANIIEPATKIIANDKVKNAYKSGNKMEVAKEVLKGNKKELVEILAALDGVPYKNYKANIPEMLNKIFELIDDMDVMQVFTSQETKDE